jgi:hypothetical protein
MGKNLLHRNSRYYSIDDNVAMIWMPGNPITGRGGPINEIDIAIELFQITYVVITITIIVKESRGARIITKEKVG